VNQLYRLAFAVCELIFLQNEDDVAHFVNARLLPARKVCRVNGTGVDLRYFSQSPPMTQVPLTFLLMGRLLREKGIYEYVEAARIVRARNKEVSFVLLGGVDPNPGGLSIEDVQRWVDDGVIHWGGHVNDVRRWIAQCSVYVLPSYREGIPRSSQEAMAMGRPIITTDAVGCRETVVHGVNGFLVPVRDAHALAAAMHRFIEDPTLVVTMGCASRRMAEQSFDVDKINTVMLRAMGLPCGEDRGVASI
jgi:glycosyltransferase involved in cell wall biosynthesis